MTVSEYLATLRRYWVLILILALACGGGAFAYAQTLAPKYRAQAEVMVIPARGESPAELAQGANYVRSLVQTYTLLVRSPEVLQPVVDELDLDQTVRELSASMDVEVPLDTFVIRIAVTGTDPELVRATTNAVAATLAETVPSISPVDDQGAPTVRVNIISPATTPQIPVAPNKRMYLLLGAGGGALAGVAAALVRRRFFSPISAREDVVGATELGVLGAIPLAGEKRTLLQALRASPNGRFAESLRQLAASLRFVDLGAKRRTIMVTSGASMEGKSSVSLALGLTLAEAGNTVLYVEADLRRPSAATYTGLEPSVGVTDVLVGDLTIADAAQTWAHENFSVLVCGTKPPNPGQTLASGELAKLIETARGMYDYVIVDSPPVLAVSDALWLSPAVDGTLVVVRASRTKVAALRRTLESLDGVGSPVLGIVLDGVKGHYKSPYYVEAAAARD